MLDQFKMMGQLAGLLKDKERLREVGQRTRERLERARVEGEAGGGAVRVTMSGAGRVVDIQLQPALVAGAEADEQSRREVETLIADAVNSALERVQQTLRRESAAAAEELGIGELPGMDQLSGFLGP